MQTLNLHINYACPLKCRYCVQREDPELWKLEITAEQMIEKVQDFMNYCNIEKCRVNISGGEPLLKYEDIQKLIEHFPDNEYEISTSGYLLDREKAQWFSYYNVYYIFSVDGTEKVTNYLRPLANGEYGYFKQLKKNLPHILYFFPNARAKLIVSKNLISEMYSTYLELERLGFKEIFITPNVYENEVDTHHPELSNGNWEEKDWENFKEQIMLINHQICLGLQNNVQRCLITNIFNPTVKMLFPDTSSDFNFNKTICTVLDYKGGSGPEKGQLKNFLSPISLCIDNLDDSLKTQQDLISRVKNDKKLLKDNICPLDPECLYFSSCIYSSCLAENIKAKNNNILIPTSFQCKTQKIYHDAAIDFINCLNDTNNEMSKWYWHKINNMKEIMLNGR
jgi:MoaA/NifB/PqqE/SkfB family radical SAM enzyme